MNKILQPLAIVIGVCLYLGLAGCACIHTPVNATAQQGAAAEADPLVIQRALETRLAYRHPKSGELIWADDNVQYIVTGTKPAD
ncbi:MAG: hypothetical protein GKR89_09630 [Candidatus Latescibacteria bacterium]|nr:hypothetical protein [Candidatus Latescibacterota bacterium]